MKVKLSYLSLPILTIATLLTASYAPKSFSTEVKQSSIKGNLIAQAKKLKPGRYCFKLQTKTLSSEAQLTLNSNNTVNGNIQATIQDQENSYFTSYVQTFKGNLRDSQLKVNVITKIENDTQQAQETWKLTDTSLSTTREKYKKIDCSRLESQDSSRRLPLKFARGSNSAVVENSVVRGSRDIYILGAKAGQTMKLSITSLENNAVFDVIAPNQGVIHQEITKKTLKLPTTGDYEIVVGGTRGNASYRLRVEIN